jgi:tetratricopeptide (TPR) repeat protein
MIRRVEEYRLGIASAITGLVVSTICISIPNVNATTGTWEARLQSGMKAYQEGHYVEAERELVAALEKAEAFGPRDPRLAVTLNELGVVYRIEEKYREAESAFKRAAAIWQQAPGLELAHAATALNNLAVLYHQRHRDAEAIVMFRQALSIEQEVLGPKHPQVAAGLVNLAVLHYDMGEYADTEEFYCRALAIDEIALGPQHPAIAPILEDYAKVLRKLDRTDEAVQLEARAKAMRERIRR